MRGEQGVAGEPELKPQIPYVVPIYPSSPEITPKEPFKVPNKAPSLKNP